MANKRKRALCLCVLCVALPRSVRVRVRVFGGYLLLIGRLFRKGCSKGG